MANRHVGPIKVGSGDGSNWQQTCAWSDFPVGLATTFARGDVVYFQDGVYGGHVLNLAESSTTSVVFKKATAQDHGSDTGWVSSTMGAGYATFTDRLFFTTRYWDMDALLAPPRTIPPDMPIIECKNTPTLHTYPSIAPNAVLADGALWA